MCQVLLAPIFKRGVNKQRKVTQLTSWSRWTDLTQGPSYQPHAYHHQSQACAFLECPDEASCGSAQVI